MSHKSHILCVSHDGLLLATRKAVLATLYETTCVSEIGSLVALPRFPGFALVLLCHTLSAEECHCASEIARQRWPATRVLTLTGPAGDDLLPGADRDIPGLAGPVALLRTIRELIPGLPSSTSASI